MSRYLVVGGSGRTGRLIVDRMISHGDHVTVASRRPTPDPRPAVDTRAVDLVSSHPDLAVDGFEGIIVCVEPPSDPAGAGAVAHRGVRTVGRLGATHNIRVVLVSQIYVTRAAARLEQGDTGDGHPSRHTLADAVTAGLREPAALGATFELYDNDGQPTRTWAELFAQLRPDIRQSADAR